MAKPIILIQEVKNPNMLSIETSFVINSQGVHSPILDCSLEERGVDEKVKKLIKKLRQHSQIKYLFFDKHELSIEKTTLFDMKKFQNLVLDYIQEIWELQDYEIIYMERELDLQEITLKRLIEQSNQNQEKILNRLIEELHNQNKQRIFKSFIPQKRY